MNLMTLILAAAFGLTHAATAWPEERETGRHQAVSTSIPALTASLEIQDPGMSPPTDYARREVDAKDLESFTGGHEVVVVCTCVVVLVLVLVLI